MWAREGFSNRYLDDDEWRNLLRRYLFEIDLPKILSELIKDPNNTIYQQQISWFIERFHFEFLRRFISSHDKLFTQDHFMCFLSIWKKIEQSIAQRRRLIIIQRVAYILQMVCQKIWDKPLYETLPHDEIASLNQNSMNVPKRYPLFSEEAEKIFWDYKITWDELEAIFEKNNANIHDPNIRRYCSDYLVVLIQEEECKNHDAILSLLRVILEYRNLKI